MIKAKAKLSISRISSNVPECDKLIHIEIIDSKTYQILCNLEVKPEAFALCLTGQSHTEVDMEFNNLCPVGKTRESKELNFRFIPTSHSFNPKDEITLRALVAPFEVESWKVDEYSLKCDPYNHHKYRVDKLGNHVFKLLFVRYTA